MEQILLSVAHLGFILGIGFYFITAMQWYSYRVERVLFHYNRYDWHAYFFGLPLLGYYALWFCDTFFNLAFYMAQKDG